MLAILRAVIRSIVKTPQKPGRATSFDPEIARAVGMAIRSAREAREIAQDAFALRAGVDRSYYGKLERGERQPTVGLLLRIASALEVSGAELLGEVERLLAIRSRRRRSAVP